MRFGYLAIAAHALVILLPSVNGLPATSSLHDDVTMAESSSSAATVEVVHQFLNNTWLENLAVRANGQVLVTILTSPDLYLVDPSNGQASLVHSFANHLSLFAIAELGHDIFYVMAGNYSQRTNSNTPGAWDIYCVDMRRRLPQVQLTAHFANATLLDGMAVLSERDGLMLVGDAGAGAVYRLNVNTGAIKLVISDPLMKPPAGAPVGIDGLQVHNRNLYYTNAPKDRFYKQPLKADGTAAGPAQLRMEGFSVDDFTIDFAGDAYMTVFYSNEIIRLRNGSNNPTVVAGPSNTTLDGPTACKLGRTFRDRNVLYIATNGGLKFPDTSTRPGGTLSRVNLASTKT